MSYYTMSNKELSQLIRKTLKESGFTSKDLSVRVRAALYDTSVNITIKNPLVRISEVEEIVKRFSEVDYDEHSGEILAGCNVYVHCQYEYGIFKDAAADLLPAAEMVLSNKEKYSGHAIADNKEKSVHIIHYQGVQWTLAAWRVDQACKIYLQAVRLDNLTFVCPEIRLLICFFRRFSSFWRSLMFLPLPDL